MGRDPYGHCQFAQFPHAINQDARLNAAFLRFSGSQWRPCTEWENPVWGILVVNYAEYALQIFLPDGTFYREVRLGGPSGATESAAWKPFAPPPADQSDENSNRFPQLDALISRLKDETYLRAFVRTIDASLASVPHAPNQYAQFLNAVVGRPLVLANFGFSLELATPPLKSQSSVSAFPPPATPTLLGYKFPVKIGDKDRVYDGLVGYFDSKADGVLGTPGGELELDALLTYFHAESDATTKSITKANYPRVSPYHLSATALPSPPDLARSHWRQMKLVGALFDPFSKLHLYSGVLPIASLQLPAWSLQQAMQRMTAFFHMGPLLVTDARAVRFDPAQELSADYNLVKLGEVADEDDDGDKEGDGGGDAKKEKIPRGVAIPAIKSAEWNWLAPFMVTATRKEKGQEKTVKDTKWNPLVIEHLDNKPKYEKGPYMAIEGFLQLKHPITAPDTI